MEINPVIKIEPECQFEDTISSTKWSPSSLQDSTRKSAFLPYKQCTVLTNLQRGNTLAEYSKPNSPANFFIKAGQGEITQGDINKNPYALNELDSFGFSALHWAAGYGQMNAVQLLLENGATVDILGPEEETALHLAASEGHHDIVKLLLSEGANVDAVDHLCNTALMFAARGNHPQSCNELLLHGAQFGLSNFNGDTAYMLAIDHNSSLAQQVIAKFIIARLDFNDK